MRSLLALVGWPEIGLPPGTWFGSDPRGRDVALLHGSAAGADGAVASNEQRTVHAVLTGTIHNSRELRATLRGRHEFSGRDDAEVLVHLYEERGIQCVSSLRGAFALALWDGRRRQLLLARDQLGLAELYYSVDGGRLAASSSLPALGVVPRITAPWDVTAVDQFLTFGYVPAPATLHPGIRQLRPGELAVWEDGRLRQQRYWQLVFPERRVAHADLVTLVREQVVDALRLRQAGQVTGVLLSGGLHAASILALAVGDQRPPAHAYTVGLPGVGDDELRAAARLATRSSVPHTTFTEPPDWGEIVDQMLVAHGAPLAILDAPLFALTAGRAAAEVDAVLAGIGGREVFGGAAPVRELEAAQRFQRLPAVARECAELWMRFMPGRRAAGLRRLVQGARLAPLGMYGRSVSIMAPELRGPLYAPEMWDALAEASPWSILSEVFADAVSAGAHEPADAFHYVELTLGLPPRVAAARAALGSLDLRLPLADHRLAHLVASVAPGQRTTATRGQVLLRNAVADVLPRGVLGARPLSSVPRRVAWRSGSLRALVEETLTPARLEAQGVFDAETIARVWCEQLAGEQNHGAILWAVIVLTRWLDQRARLQATVAPATPRPRATAAT
jgi:asparagine synthase (glutamine-hydrolysing)